MEAFIQKIREYLRKHHHAKRLRQAVMTLAALVIFATTYMLILPAITIDQDTASTDPAIIMEADREEGAQEAADKADDADQAEQKAAEAAPDKEPAQAEDVKAEPEEAEPAQADAKGADAAQAEVQRAEAKGADAAQAEAQGSEPAAANAGASDSGNKAGNGNTAAGKEDSSEGGISPGDSAQTTSEDYNQPAETTPASGVSSNSEPAAGEASYETEDFTITVTWDKDAGLMADTALNLQELIREERKEPTPYDYVNEEYYDGYVDGTRHALQKSIDKTVEIADVRFLQLYLTYEGQIVTPKNKVKVDIEYKKPMEKVEKTTIKAVHFDTEKEEPVVLPVKVKVKPGEDGASDTIEKLTFETSRISFYGITYVQLNSDKADEGQTENLN